MPSKSLLFMVSWPGRDLTRGQVDTCHNCLLRRVLAPNQRRPMHYLLTAFLSLMLPVMAMAKRAALPEKEKAEVLQVLEKNDKLFNAYLKKDSAQIEAGAKELEKALADTKTPVLKDVRKNGG